MLQRYAYELQVHWTLELADPRKGLRGQAARRVAVEDRLTIPTSRSRPTGLASQLGIASDAVSTQNRVGTLCAASPRGTL